SGWDCARVPCLVPWWRWRAVCAACSVAGVPQRWALQRRPRWSRALSGSSPPMGFLPCSPSAWDSKGEEPSHDATLCTAYYDQRTDHGLWEFRDPTRSDVSYPAGGDLHHYGRQWVWEEYAAAPSHWPPTASARRGAVRRAEFLGRPP